MVIYGNHARGWGAWTKYRISPNCLNKCTPRLLIFPGNISETARPILTIFPALNLKVFRGSPYSFHCDQTRVRVRFLPPCQTRLFGEIWYVKSLGHLPYGAGEIFAGQVKFPAHLPEGRYAKKLVSSPDYCSLPELFGAGLMLGQ